MTAKKKTKTAAKTADTLETYLVSYPDGPLSKLPVRVYVPLDEGRGVLLRPRTGKVRKVIACTSAEAETLRGAGLVLQRKN